MLGLESLESRKERFDLIQTFKILNGIDAVDSEVWFTQVGKEVVQIARNTSYHKNQFVLGEVDKDKSAL